MSTVKISISSHCFCDTNLDSIEELKLHYTTKHIYCRECNDLLTDEDALHKHNLKEHGVQVMPEEDSLIEESLTIKEEPIGCNGRGHCDTCI